MQRSAAERLGVAFDADTLRADGDELRRGKGNNLRISTIDFSGRLCVLDPQALQAAPFGGVGHAEAFGCGPLLVKPLHAIS